MMRREEFEEWLEVHKDEAIERIEAEELSLTNWVNMLARALKAEVGTDGDSQDDLNLDDEFALEE